MASRMATRVATHGHGDLIGVPGAVFACLPEP